MKHAAALLFLLLSLGAAVAAAPIYRCGPDGRVYSQTPCEGGRLIDAADPRSEADRIEARRVAARERKLATDLERERRAQEVAQQPATATGIDSRPSALKPAAPSPRAKPKHRGAKPKKGSGDFVAIEPRSAKNRR